MLFPTLTIYCFYFFVSREESTTEHLVAYSVCFDVELASSSVVDFSTKDSPN